MMNSYHPSAPIRMDYEYKHYIFIILIVLFISCKEKDTSRMTFTTNKVDSVEIGVSGSWGTTTIDWGSGCTIRSDVLGSLPEYFIHSYSDNKTHTIALQGSRPNTITDVQCYNNKITRLDISNNPKLKILNVLKNDLESIDVSKNPELTQLNCTWNKLKSIDLSKNTLLENFSCENNLIESLEVGNNPKLRSIFIRSNQMDEKHLNRFFESLHGNEILEKSIFIGGNPGTQHCDLSIATDKGWVVDTVQAVFK